MSQFEPRRVRLALTLGTSLAGLAFAATSPAMAQATDPGTGLSSSPTQDATAPQGDEAAQAGAQGRVGDTAPSGDTSGKNDIVVTGSRIRRPDFASPSPIVSLGSETIQESGTTNLTDFLSGYPALVGSSTAGQNAGDNAGIGSTGINLLNLRNLGTQRTLVLIDGRRQVAGVPGEQAVDINTIPNDLVEGIDVLTGGASAIYGADGVTGVVNFRLKQNFEGISARAQAGTSSHGDAGQRLLDLTVGTNFAGGRGNIAFAYEHGEEDRLQAKDRKRLREGNLQSFVPNPNDPNDDPNLPDYVPLRDIRYDASAPNGAIDTTFDGYPEFTGSGAVWDPGTYLGNGLTQGGSATSVASYGNDLLPQVHRDIFNFIGHYDVSDKLTLFAEGKYADVTSISYAQPTFDYYIFVPADNPYLPANVRAAIDPDIGGVLVNRDNFDLGQRGENIRRQTYRGVIGARGDISDSFHYELSYVYGKTKVRSRYLGDINNDRFFAAVDAVTDPATGQITCRANLDASWEPNQPYSSRTATPVTTFSQGQCVPLNLFSTTQSAEAINFITAPTTDYSSIEQQVISGSISGDFRQLFELPGGPIGFAIGGEYRQEKSSFNPDPIEQQGLTYTNVLSPTRGKFHVTEFFGELNAPIVKNRPFFHDLELGAAIRFSDYSTIGRTTTWKVDGMWAPVKDITFRGTYSVAIRAPNIGELFGGSSQTYEFFNDPCSTQNLNNGTSYRAANCRALLTGLGADASTFTDPRSVNIAGLQGGNANLQEEEAKTWTAGIVLAPSFLPGFTASFDWYNINLENAINTVDPQQLAELCVDQPSLDNQFCSSITRQNGGTNAGLITGFTVQPQNVAAFKTAGLDINLNYRLRTAKLGTFNLKLVGGYLDKLNFVGTPGADPTDERGTAYAPKYQATADLTWSLGKVTLNYGLSWFDKTLRASRLTVAGDPDYYAPEYLYYKARWQHDFYASVDVNQSFQLYGGVNNLFGQKPDVGSNSYPISSVGRYMFVGVRARMPRL